ncbi:MAG: tyrosine-type recombinase/integrase [Terriglobales bacterium]
MTDQAADGGAVVAEAKPKRRKPPKVRGLYEKHRGSGIWWVRYADADGREHREKAGTRGMAIALLDKRRMERRQGVKMPETLRRKAVTAGELIQTAVAYGRDHHASQKGDNHRSRLLLELFGATAADGLAPAEIERKLGAAAAERRWKPATFNRYKAFLSLAYPLALANGHVKSNPARLVRMRREDNARVRWLSAEEEPRLRMVIERDYPGELPAFLLALHSGMRRSEQYGLRWDCVDFRRRQLTIPKSKNGSIRYIPLDDTAIEALLALRDRGEGTGPVMVAAQGGHGKLAGEALKTPREWFAAACAKAGVADFTWHCLRHSFASRLIMAGVSLAKVKELMGHKSYAMTLRYAHLAPDHLLDAVKMLDAWGRGPADVQSGTRTGTSGFGGSGAGAGEASQRIVQ